MINSWDSIRTGPQPRDTGDGDPRAGHSALEGPPPGGSRRTLPVRGRRGTGERGIGGPGFGSVDLRVGAAVLHRAGAGDLFP
ncbi:hypothetical protein GCM10010273_14920 [Streptomyces lavendulocolor]